jgi:hypothetical protein
VRLTPALMALALVLGGCRRGSSEIRYQRLPETKVDSAARNRAQTFTLELLKRWKAGQFQLLSSESTEIMRSRLAPQAQREAWESVQGEFGDFKSLNYAETWGPQAGGPVRVYRFRGKFSGTAPAEVRVVLDSAGKVAGFWVKPWRDELS